MAIRLSRESSRQTIRRRDTVDEALHHAVAIMTTDGVGGLSISEIARRMRMRPPSLYKYFDSRHALYDRLFARGLVSYDESVKAAAATEPRGIARIRAGMRSGVAWSVANPALAQLLFWRPVPGFTPSSEVFADSIDQMSEARAEFAVAVAAGELSAEADSDEAVRLMTVVISGLLTQQLANEPGTAFADGSFSRLADEAIDMFLAHYQVPDAR